MKHNGLGVLVEIAVGVFVLSLVLGQILGQPILLGFVETGSMEPTIDTGDGFIAIPAPIAGPVEKGDVVVFRAKELHGGGLTTHRVVDETERGYITKGDANPVPDQEGAEPPVKDEQIVTVVWQPGGEVVTVPGIGTAITTARETVQLAQRELAAALGTRSLLGAEGLGPILFALSIVFYIIDARRSSDRDQEAPAYDRQLGMNAHLLVLGFTIVVVLGATVVMVVPAGAEEHDFVSSVSDAPGQGVIERGTSESTVHPVSNDGVVPVVVFFETESERIDVHPRELTLPARSVQNVTLTLSAPPETGHYRQFLGQYRYLHVFPLPVIRVLYGLHPWVPIILIDTALGIAAYGLGVVLIGTGRIRVRSRSRDRSLLRRVQYYLFSR